MDRLIMELKQEHEELFVLLEAFKKGRGVDGTGWKENLFAAKKLFLEHLKKEDEELYPRLRAKWAGDKTMDAIVTKYIDDMKKISQETVVFLDRYNTASAGTDFMKDYAEMMVDLKSRMREEEEKLFRELEK
jgi:hypothetical protein